MSDIYVLWYYNKIWAISISYAELMFHLFNLVIWIWNTTKTNLPGKVRYSNKGVKMHMMSTCHINQKFACINLPLSIHNKWHDTYSCIWSGHKFLSLQSCISNQSTFNQWIWIPRWLYNFFAYGFKLFGFHYLQMTYHRLRSYNHIWFYYSF